MAWVIELWERRVRAILLSQLFQAVIIFALFSMLFYWRVFFAGEVLSAADILKIFYPWRSMAPEGFAIRNTWMSDTIDWVYPAQLIAREAFRNGSVPLWNPYASAGTPMAALVNYGLFYPLSLVYLLGPLKLGISLHAALRFFLAAFGTYLFVRELDLSHVAGIIGGVAFAGCAFNIVWVGSMASYVSTLAPLTFFFTQRLVKRPSLLNASGLAISIASMIAGGFVAVAGYCLYALGAYALVTIFQMYRDNRCWKRALKHSLLWGGAVLAGFLIISMQLIPFAKFLTLTSYDEYRTHWTVEAWPDPYAEELVRLFVPDYYGHPVDGNEWLPPGVVNYAEGSGYIGILPWLLSSLGVLKSSSRQRWFFLGLTIVAFGMVYNLPWRSLLIYLPIINSSPTKRIVSVLCLGLSVLAAMGTDALIHYARDWTSKNRVALLVVVSLGLVMIATVALTDSYWTTAQDREFTVRTLTHVLLQSPQESWSSAYRVFSFLFWLSSGLTVISLALKGALKKRVLSVALVALTTADMFVFGMRYIPTLSPEDVFPTTPGIEWLRENGQGHRFAAFGSVLWPSIPTAYQLEDVRGHDPLITDRYRRVLMEIDPNSLVGHGTVSLFAYDSAVVFSPWLDLLGVEFLALPPGTAALEPPEHRAPLELVYDGSDLTIYRYTDAAPRFYVADRILVAPDDEDQIAIVEGSGFQTGSDAVVASMPPSLSSDGASGTVEVVDYQAEHVRLRVNMAEAGLLVTSEKVYPGWNAYIDGVVAPVERANYLFRAVAVPAGQHTVEFVFEPSDFYLGVKLSAITIALMGLGLIGSAVLNYRRRTLSKALVPWSEKKWDLMPGRVAIPFVVAGVVVVGTALFVPVNDTSFHSLEGAPVALYGPNTLGRELTLGTSRLFRTRVALSVPSGSEIAIVRLYNGGPGGDLLAAGSLLVEGNSPRWYEILATIPADVSVVYLELLSPEADYTSPLILHALSTLEVDGLKYNDRVLAHLDVQVNVSSMQRGRWLQFARDYLDHWWWENNGRFPLQTWHVLCAISMTAAIAALILPYKTLSTPWSRLVVSAAFLGALVMIAVAPATKELLSQGAFSSPDVRLISRQSIATAPAPESYVVVDLLAEFYAQTLVIDTPQSHYVHTSRFELDGQRQPVLFMHPPSYVSYSFEVPPEARLRTAAAMSPEVWNPDRGDGVLFIIRVVVDGIEETVYYQEIDPKNWIEDRHWHDVDVDLSPYAGQTVTLLFITYPLETSDWDWAGWRMPVVLVLPP